MAGAVADDYLGHARHDPAGRDSGNSRNGHRTKTVLIETWQSVTVLA
jgi:putative transposase